MTAQAVTEADLLRAEAMAELECRRCFGRGDTPGDGMYFTQTYTKIEDRSSGRPAWVPFVLWPAQVDVWELLERERFVLILKARQLGLTWLLLARSLWKLCAVRGFRVLGLSKKYDFARTNLLERLVNMLRRLPRWMIRERTGKGWKAFSGHTWEKVADEVRIYHPLIYPDEPQDVSIFSIMATTSEGARSFTADMIVLDEYAFAENPEELWSAMVPIIDQPGSTQQGVLLSTNQAGTHFDQLIEEASQGRGTFAHGFIFLPWNAHPLRDQAWYEAAAEKDPLFYRREYPATIEDSRSVSQGTFFQSFSRSIHVVEPFEIPAWWRRWLSNDPGYTDPFAWYWMAVDGDGIVYVYREYAPRLTRQDPRLTYSEQAAEVAKLSRIGQLYGQPEYEAFDFLVVGRDAYTKHPETGKAIADYYMDAFDEAGFSIGIVPTEADRARRAAIMTEYLKPYQDQVTGRTTAQVRIFSSCTHLIRALPMMISEEKHPEKYADHALDHAVDAMGYGLQQWHPDKAQAPEENKTFIQRDKEWMASRAGRRRRAM